MTVKEIRRIDTDKLRHICINNNWYTCGTNADYSKMFAMCEKDNITTNDLYKIAKDIYEHTDVKSAVNGCDASYSDDENVLNMMIYVNDASYVFYEMKK